MHQSFVPLPPTRGQCGKTVRELKEYLAQLRNTSFVLSTSAARDGAEPKDNLYMWGHYANGPRGSAIEFDAQALASAASQQHEGENRQPSEDSNVWARIEYAKTFPPITAEYVYEFMKQEIELRRRKTATRPITQLDRYYDRMSIIKSDVWQSENEWRLMWRSTDATGRVYKCPIGEDAIVGRHTAR